MVLSVFCCRAGETSSHERKVYSLGVGSNVITTSTENGKVNPLLATSSDILDATMKI